MGRRKKTYVDTSARSLAGGKGGECLSLNLKRLINHYSNIALNMYEWEGLPKGVEGRHIEWGLYNNGQIFFTKTDVGFIALPCSAESEFNVYGDPLRVLVSGRGYTKSFGIDKGIRMLNNPLGTATRLDVMYYCKKIDDIEFSITRNLKYQNSPFIFGATRETEFSARLIMDKIDNNETHIILDKNFETEGKLGIEKIDLKKEFIADKLRIEQTEYEKQLLTRLGLNCSIKKEGGMSTTELNSNNMEIEMNQDLGLKYRKIACEEINKKFGLNISVKAVADRLNFIVDDNGNCTHTVKEGGNE